MEREDKPTIELIDYYCGECGGEYWTLKIGHCDDGRTFLYAACADPNCCERKREEMGLGEDAPIVWGEYDITGQGHDPQDMVSEETKKEGLN